MSSVGGKLRRGGMACSCPSPVSQFVLLDTPCTTRSRAAQTRRAHWDTAHTPRQRWSDRMSPTDTGRTCSKMGRRISPRHILCSTGCLKRSTVPGRQSRDSRRVQSPLRWMIAMDTACIRLSGNCSTYCSSRAGTWASRRPRAPCRTHPGTARMKNCNTPSPPDKACRYQPPPGCLCQRDRFCTPIGPRRPGISLSGTKHSPPSTRHPRKASLSGTECIEQRSTSRSR